MVRIAERVTPVACATPLEAQVRELRLITEHAPRYNRRSKFPERHSWVRLTDEAYPRLSVVGSVVAGAAHIGPFGSRRTAQEAVHALHDALNLRQCTARIPLVSKQAGSPCALAGMGRCSAPCVATEAPDTSYEDVADAARSALTGDPGPVVRALSDRIATLAHQERYEEAGEVTRRLRAFVSGAHRAQRLDPLARCAELVAARPSGIGDAPGKPGGWEIVVIKHGRLAATDVSAPGASPLPLVSALRTTAEHVEPPVAPAPAAHPEETDLLLAWLDSPGVRLVHLSDTWACPVRAAGAHADLAWVSDRVQVELGAADTGCGRRGRRNRHRPGAREPATRGYDDGMLTAIVLIDAETSRIPEVAQEVANIDGVSEVFSVTGKTDLVAIVRVPEHEQLAGVVSDSVNKVPGVQNTETLIAFRAFSKADLEQAFALGLDD